MDVGMKCGNGCSAEIGSAMLPKNIKHYESKQDLRICIPKYLLQAMQGFWCPASPTTSRCCSKLAMAKFFTAEASSLRSHKPKVYGCLG